MTYSSQRHDRDEAEREPECSIPVKEVRDEAERNEEEEDIEIGAEEEELVGREPGRLVFDVEGVCKTREERLRRLRAVSVFKERRSVGHGRHGGRNERAGRWWYSGIVDAPLKNGLSRDVCLGRQPKRGTASPLCKRHGRHRDY